MSMLKKSAVDDSSLDHDCADEGFDRKLQQWHAIGLVNVSAATRAQLQQRRRSVLAGHGAGTAPRVPTSRRLLWADALALLAIAIALPAALLMPHGPDSTTADANITAPNLVSPDLTGSNLANSSFTDSTAPNDSMANSDHTSASYRTNANSIASAGSTRPDVVNEQTGVADELAPSPLATLEEDPELFMWLDSHDAIALASE